MMQRVLAVLTASLCLAALGASLGVWPGGTARAQDDDLVPAGVWRVRLDDSRTHETQARAESRATVPLLHYLVRDETVRAQISGSIERSIQRVDTEVLYGLRDGWNLRMRLPWLKIKQTSTLTATTADPTVQDEVDRLQSRTISGVGRLQLASLHRPVFNDRHGFVWGYGVDWPLRRPASPWAGRGTLLLDEPDGHVFFFGHYTYYLLHSPTRLDVRAEAGVSVAKRIALEDGRSAPVNTGHGGMASLGWSRDFGPFMAGLDLQKRVQGASSVDGLSQSDGLSEDTYSLRLGYGNLNRLESGPVAFPYALELGYERTISGNSIPIRSEARLGFRFYF